MQRVRQIIPATLLLSVLIQPLGTASPKVNEPSNHVAEERSNEPGPAWDSRPAWQRAGDGFWFTIFRRRPVDSVAPSVIVPVAGSIPFRIPRAMTATPQEMAEPAAPLDLAGTPGSVVSPPCKNSGPSSRVNLAEEKQMVAKLNGVISVLRSERAFPPPGHQAVVQCTYRKDGAVYRGRLLILLYPTSDPRHLWHGAVEIMLNDLGMMGPRANSEDRLTDDQLVYRLPDPATYLGHPYLGPPGGEVWGGIYLSKRPGDIFRPLTYREWLDNNLSGMETAYRTRQAQLRPKATVTEQVLLRNNLAAYERALQTKELMPANELDAPLWLSSEGPSDAANYQASRNVRLNTPGYFDRTKPAWSVQLINIIPVDLEYNPVRVLLEQLDFNALQNMLE